MQFGLFYEWPNPPLRNWKILFEEGVQQIQLSEELGFDYCLIAEHHFTNYGNSPSPLLQALYIGQRTKRIRIGTAAVILPVWQPLRLAEEIAVYTHYTVPAATLALKSIMPGDRVRRSSGSSAVPAATQRNQRGPSRTIIPGEAGPCGREARLMA